MGAVPVVVFGRNGAARLIRGSHLVSTSALVSNLAAHVGLAQGSFAESRALSRRITRDDNCHFDVHQLGKHRGLL